MSSESVVSVHDMNGCGQSWSNVDGVRYCDDCGYAEEALIEVREVTDVDLQAEAQIDWWQQAHDLAEGRRQHLEKACERALAHLEKSLEADEFGDVWEHWQKARKLLRKELGK